MNDELEIRKGDVISVEAKVVDDTFDRPVPGWVTIELYPRCRARVEVSKLTAELVSRPDRYRCEGCGKVTDNMLVAAAHKEVHGLVINIGPEKS